MSSGATRDPSAVADALLSRAKAAGADAADVVVVTGESLSVSAQDGALEEIEREESFDFGLRVLIDAPDGAREAVVSASDPSSDALLAVAERAVAMAREAPPVDEAGLASADEIERSPPNLDLADADPPPAPDALLETALALEAAAREVVGVLRAEGAGAGWRVSDVLLRGDNGVDARYLSGSHSISVSAVASVDAGSSGMERDYAFAGRRRAKDLPSAASVGAEAGERATKRLSPRRGTTGRFPVIFEPRVAAGIASSLLGAANGAAVARGSTFLAARMGERLLPAGVDLIDDPTLPGALGSRPIDGDGLPVRRKKIVDDGVLSAWLLDLASARKLGLTSNGSASRGVGAGPSPSPSNAWLSAGDASPEDLVRDVAQGLFVTEMMGRGLNPVTGDYSRGASGFWIENGEIAYPVSELTVAGAMLEMAQSLTPANDLTLDRRIASPSLRIEGLTIAAE